MSDTSSSPPISAAVLSELIGVRTAITPAPVQWVQAASPDASVALWKGSVVVDAQGTEMPCLLFRPQTPGPHPAVVAIHQHNDEYEFGKGEPAGLSGDPNAAYGLELAKQGFLVAIPDLVGFEERGFAHGRSGRELELFLALNAVAYGRSLHGTHVSDVLAVVNYLEAYEDVLGPVAVAGHSLGGQIALLILAVEPRIKVGVISCGLTTIDACQRAGIVHNPGWYIPGLESRGGYTALAGSLADKKILSISASHDEHFPANGAQEVLDAFGQGIVDSRWRVGSHAMDPESLSLVASWLSSSVTGA